MDNGQNLISDFKIMNPNTGNWTDLRQARKKEEKKNGVTIRQAKDVSPTRTAAATRNNSMNDFTSATSPIN